ncbi:MAG: transglycosylase domain-containing protein [Actinomycetaceae bacterium]|nr:transglycosylase domain-containing protein [Actinomycetaceae bacterium]MDY6082270.1 transglycosylase domain-containing protein [Actinomycetaceae bacterium]
MPSKSSPSVGHAITIAMQLLALCVVGGLLLAGLAIPAVGTSAATFNAGSELLQQVPSDLGFIEGSEQSVILANDGSVIARFYAENRINVASDQISKNMKEAIVSIEDRRFFEHRGIDLQGTLGALVNNITGNDIAGGSSITQQYVKNALIERGRLANDPQAIDEASEKTIGRKINEARYAVSIEKSMTKDQILTGYLNLAQFGPSTYGVETASLRYFSKHAKDLTIPEAALIAGITKSPAYYNPLKNPDEATKRRNIVIDQMYHNGYITADQQKEAKATTLKSMLKPSSTQNGCAQAGTAAYFCEYVVKTLINDNSWGKNADDRVNMLYRGGLVVQTTLDPVKQEQAYTALTNRIPVNDSSKAQTALSTMQPGTGYILAMAQNTNYGEPADDDPTATQVNLNSDQSTGGGGGFQSGSTFKIFTLLDWLKAGHSVYETVSGSSVTFPPNSFTIPCNPGAANTSWTVHNAEAAVGMMSVYRATAESINAAYARMAQQLNLCDIAQTAKDFGVVRGDGSPLQVIPAMVLGTNEVTPLSMTQATAGLAADGKVCAPLAYTSVKNTQGDVLLEAKPSCKQAVDPELAREVNAVLQAVPKAGGTAPRAAVPGHTIAGKTGTTNDWIAAWFVGYTPQEASSVWVGHQSGNHALAPGRIGGTYMRTMYGGDYPAQIYSAFTSKSLAGQPNQAFTPPSRQILPPSRPSSPRRSTNRAQSSDEATTRDQTDQDSRSTGSDNKGDAGKKQSTPQKSDNSNGNSDSSK